MNHKNIPCFRTVIQERLKLTVSKQKEEGRGKVGVKKYAKAYLEKFTSEREFIKELPLGKKIKIKIELNNKKQVICHLCYA